MPPKAKELFYPVRDPDHWTELTSPDNNKVTVIDLYYPWFGRCDALDEALRGIYMNIDDPEKKLQYLYLDLSKPDLKPFGDKEVPEPTAKPRFFIYQVRINKAQNGELKADISGANYTLLKDKILTLIESMGDGND